MFSPLSSIAAVLILLSISVFSQTPAMQPNDLKIQKLKEAWLERIYKDTLNLKLPENRAIADAKLGSFYWETNQKRARALFGQAIDELKTAEREATHNLRDPNYQDAYSNARQTILPIIISKDESLGFDLFIKSRPQIVSDALAGRPLPVPPNPVDGAPFKIVSLLSNGSSVSLAQQLIRRETSFEASLAMSVIKTNPKWAIDILSRLSPGDVSEWTDGMLARLNEKDSVAAKALANEIIRKILATDLTGNQSEISFVTEVLTYYLPEHKSQNILQIDEDLIHQLAEKEADFLIKNANGPRPSNYTYLYSPKPILVKLLPERAVELNEKINSCLMGLPPNFVPVSKESQDILNNGSPEKILSEAEKYPASTKDRFYTAAALKTASAGDINRAKAILAEHFSGQSLANSYENLYSSLASNAQYKGDYDKALEFNEQLKPESRYWRLIDLAIAIQTKTPGDNQKAKAVLAQARQLVSPTPDTGENFQNLINIAPAYALIEPETGFQMLNMLVRKADQITAATAISDGFREGVRTIRQNEYYIGGLNYHLLLLNLPIKNFIDANFERTFKIFSQVRRPDLRVALELHLFENDFRSS